MGHIDDPRARLRALWENPRSLENAPVGQPGHDLPHTGDHEWQPLGDGASNNWMMAPPGYHSRLNVDVKGRDNVIVIGKGCTIHSEMIIANNGATIIFGENTGENGGRLNVFGNGERGLLFIGRRTTCNGAAFFLLGDDARIILGEDCMLAHAIMLRTNDDHAMIDMTTGRQLNPTDSIVIKPHVWICPEATILRGTGIGFGSVVGTKSVVRGQFADYCLLAGAPARMVRSNVSWDRRQMAPEHHHLAIQHFEHQLYATRMGQRDD